MRAPTTAPSGRRRLWPVTVHAPLVAFLTLSVLLTDDRGQTWTRLSELLLAVFGLPFSFITTSVLAFSGPGPDWVVDAVWIGAAWLNVALVAMVTRRGLPARPVAEAAAMVAAGVGIWAALLSWAPQATFALVQSAAAVVAVAAVVALLSRTRQPVLVAAYVGGGAYVAVCAHTALNSAFWIFLAVPLGVATAAVVAVAAWVGFALRARDEVATSPR